MEFAISAPVVLLMVLFGIDFGRVFMGWITLTNAVREAANFAALNPSAWTAPGNPAAQTEFDRLIAAEAANLNCTLPATLPDPTFPNGTSVGSPALVAVTCQFSLLTPLMGTILGSPIDVSASASFPVRSGAIAGTGGGGGGLPPIGPVVPTPTIAPTPSPIITPSPAPTPVPKCTVPNLKNKDSSVAVAGFWVAAGFTANNLIFDPLVPPHYKIRTQTIAFNSSVPCSSSMTVTP
ncbi:MAG TPA: TadE/TadG family type IV pilus assembly protein [Nonomuraea sp.]|nr:TadE/TadG family type IV pilus assembly protein [Nonomuraea sp.]